MLKESNTGNIERIVAELRTNNIKYRFDDDRGYIFVAERNINQAKRLLFAAGLYSNALLDNRSEILNSNIESHTNEQNPGLPFYALEKELAKTITTIEHVQSARIHLAISPNQNKNGDSLSRASVVVKLDSGHHLTESQILSISQLVAASVPDLRVDNITIVNQSGKLLKSAGNSTYQNNFTAQFEYQRRIELNYIERIENVVSPILGADNFHVEVNADLHNSDIESNEKKSQKILHIPMLKRLTVSILVDDKLLSNEEGQLIKIPRSRVELNKISQIVKNAIDFNESRGDIVNIVNESFGPYGKSTQLDLLPFWRESWFVDVVKLFIIIVVSLTVSVYLFKALLNLVRKPQANTDSTKDDDSVKTESPDLHLPRKEIQPDNLVANSDPVDQVISYEQLIAKVRSVVLDDPVLAANILKTWVRHNAG